MQRAREVRVLGSVLDRSAAPLGLLGLLGLGPPRALAAALALAATLAAAAARPLLRSGEDRARVRLRLDRRRDIPREVAASEVSDGQHVAEAADARRRDAAVVGPRARHARPLPVAVVPVRAGGQRVARVAFEVERGVRPRHVPPRAQRAVVRAHLDAVREDLPRGLRASARVSVGCHDQGQGQRWGRGQGEGEAVDMARVKTRARPRARARNGRRINPISRPHRGHVARGGAASRGRGVPHRARRPVLVVGVERHRTLDDARVVVVRRHGHVEGGRILADHRAEDVVTDAGVLVVPVGADGRRAETRVQTSARQGKEKSQAAGRGREDTKEERGTGAACRGAVARTTCVSPQAAPRTAAVSYTACRACCACAPSTGSGRSAHHAAAHVRIRPGGVRTVGVARGAVEDAAVEDVLGGLDRVAPRAAARLEPVLDVPAAPLHVPKVDGLARVRLLDVPQRALEPVEVDERVVVALAEPARAWIERGRRPPEVRALLRHHAHVWQPLAAGDKHEVALSRAGHRGLLFDGRQLGGELALVDVGLVDRLAEDVPHRYARTI
eukprot:6432667-Prymnesium_polylepis.1